MVYQRKPKGASVGVLSLILNGVKLETSKTKVVQFYAVTAQRSNFTMLFASIFNVSLINERILNLDLNHKSAFTNLSKPLRPRDCRSPIARPQLLLNVLQLTFVFFDINHEKLIELKQYAIHLTQYVFNTFENIY